MGFQGKKASDSMGFQPKKKKGFQNWKLGFYSDSVWDSKIYVGFQKNI